MYASSAVIERDRNVIAPCQRLSYFPLVVERAEGAILTDIDGREYIDFLSSAASLNLGSSHPVVTAAIAEQLSRFSQYTAAYSYNLPMVEYAERLTSAYPGGLRAKLVFGNSGSDANDAAVKFSRAYTGRHKVIVFINGYHGSTYGSATMTTCSVRARERMGPFLPEVYAFPFFGTDVDDERCERECLLDIERAFSTWLPAREVAAVVIEPVQGDGGLLPAHPIFMKKLHGLCRENGILFISEEVQQGFYRTGTLFGIEHYGIVPDGLILGKSLGAGLTLGAFMARAEIMDCLPAPAHTFTLAGNALACAAGAAAFDFCRSEGFQRQLAEGIAALWAEAEALRAAHPETLSFVRGLGMSMGIGVRGGADAAYKLVHRCYEKGLVLISLCGNILRIQPPLTITGAELRRGFAILAGAISELESGLIPDSVLENHRGW